MNVDWMGNLQLGLQSSTQDIELFLQSHLHRTLKKLLRMVNSEHISR